ncbi:MAG: SDR family NAD(P)-dependent oxidoreductase [Treponema sp.]|nr:SDR family NAD(P)-dependent oxidoreductase [Treponema sp.]MCL2251455.1 SDR family NAD(P)-dependent oxidoreductase [Treponema sp.]
MQRSIKYLNFWKKYGPYALVAGGSNGLGAAFAEALARRGLNLVLIAREIERLEETAKKIREKYSVDVTTFAADLADFEKTKTFLSDFKHPINILVYNAAFAPIGLFENTSEDNLSLAASVNVRTPLLLVKYLSGAMIQNERGGIVLMSSLAGGQGSPNLAAYAATKAFNAVLAEGLWKELKPHGIDVIGCCAGAILTPGYENANSDRAKDEKPAPGTMTAKDVAEQTLNALGKGPIIIPGTVNKIARFLLTRLLTKKAAISIMSSNTGGLS